MGRLKTQHNHTVYCTYYHRYCRGRHHPFSYPLPSLSDQGTKHWGIYQFDSPRSGAGNFLHHSDSYFTIFMFHSDKPCGGLPLCHFGSGCCHCCSDSRPITLAGTLQSIPFAGLTIEKLFRVAVAYKKYP